MFTFIDPFKRFLRMTVNNYYTGCTEMHKLNSVRQLSKDIYAKFTSLSLMV